MARNRVGNRPVSNDRNFDHVAARLLEPFAYRFRDLVRLAQRDPDLPLLVTGCDEGRKGKASSAFDDLGDTVDIDDVLGELRFSCSLIAPIPLVAAISIAPIPTVSLLIRH
jgi:hypothetical protein